MPRKTKKIPSNKTILIVVEGQTEQIYFSEMNVYERIRGITVTIRESPHSDIEHVIKTALSEYESRVYDSIWCVYDTDTVYKDNLEEKLSRSIARATKKGIRIADSMPAFEVWILAHYQKPQFYYENQNVVIEELKKYIEDYSKDQRWLERKRIYSALKEKQEQAFANSIWLEHVSLEYGEKCTSCIVHELVMFLLNGAKNSQ